jgi:hypothetical protein
MCMLEVRMGVGRGVTLSEAKGTMAADGPPRFARGDDGRGTTADED